MAVDRGLLFLVVGPSGVGKDTLIAHARGALADNPRFSFPRRLITRGRDAVGEDHVALSQAEFERGLANGGYALSWQAHGHAYALPWDLEQCLRCGVHVVANVSRTVIGEARIRFAPVRVIAVEAAPELLAARLSERGRETAAEQQDRLARRDLAVPPGPDVVRFVNDPPLADARARFTDLRLCAGWTPRGRRPPAEPDLGLGLLHEDRCGSLAVIGRDRPLRALLRMTFPMTSS